MRYLLLHWLWLVCLLVAVQLPAIFLRNNIRAYPGQRMWSLLGKEPLIDGLVGGLWLSVLVLLVLLAAFAGWKVALFVLLADMALLALDCAIAASLGLMDHPTYCFVIGPALWGIFFLVLLIINFLQ